ncbi:hypothetical protein ACI7BZ_12290 [Xanthobacter sp. AM11]|uniref:hypothetical protein n=1 Tax=Xanthobacter sp. AM11 TaxID=3380643 RepID=UPI0039BF4FE9
MREHPTTRRALLKATGALGTIAALAVPVAVLPKAEAAEMADAELLAMGRELEARWARERELVTAAAKLDEVAHRDRPAPSAALLAYNNEGAPLFQFRAGAYRLNTHVMVRFHDYERAWRITGFRESPCPEADLLADLATWKGEGKLAREACGATAAGREVERAAAACGELAGRIVDMQAKTPAGLAVKLRALTICRADDPEDDWIGEVITSPGYSTDERMAFSVLRDALTILGVGGAHV